MTTKTTSPRPANPHESPPDDLQTAYQAHTLVQMLCARLAAAPSWAPVVPAPYTPLPH